MADAHSRSPRRGIAEVIGRLTSMQEDIAELAGQRDRLRLANEEASRELQAKRDELATMQRQIDDLKRLLPDAAGDERIRMDVGGQAFTMYRSTLSQVEGSMLGTLVSSRWLEGMRDVDDAIFLDWSPDAFREIADYLRMRRLDSTESSNFSPQSVKLARYLGIPIDRIKGSRTEVEALNRIGRGCGAGLAFSLALPQRFDGFISSFEVESELPTACTVFAKVGGYEDSLDKAADWQQCWSGSLQPGWNRIPLEYHLTNGMLVSFLIFSAARTDSGRGGLLYSKTCPPDDGGRLGFERGQICASSLPGAHRSAGEALFRRKGGVHMLSAIVG